MFYPKSSPKKERKTQDISNGRHKKTRTKLFITTTKRRWKAYMGCSGT
jgi:hypothetical protein